MKNCPSPPTRIAFPQATFQNAKFIRDYSSLGDPSVEIAIKDPLESPAHVTISNQYDRNGVTRARKSDDDDMLKSWVGWSASGPPQNNNQWPEANHTTPYHTTVISSLIGSLQPGPT